MQDIVARVLDARARRVGIPAVSASYPGLGIEQAYAIQEALRAEMHRRGLAPIGWKLAATGPNGQAVLGTSHPIYGPLFPDCRETGATVALGDFIDMGVEAEIAFRMAADLAGPGVTAQAAGRAVAAVFPALELPDLVFSTRPTLTDFIINAAAASAIVLGAPFVPPPGFDLASERVTFHRGDECLGENVASELMGHPLEALAWLANQLGARGLGLRAGDVVMSGGLSALIRVNPGDRVTACFSRIGTVSATFAC